MTNVAPKQDVSVVIMDLDNTLYDWLGIWQSSFTAMLDRLTEELKGTKIKRETLLSDFKAVHEKYGTSEYSFSIQELPSLQKEFPGEDLAIRFEAPIKAYREARKSALKLYPDVLETLETLKDKGCLLIAYTESAEFYTARRVKRLGLDRILDHVWSSPDSDMPEGLTRERARKYPDEYYELRRTVKHILAKGELKPNPKVLCDIIASVGAEPSQVIYIGDSLMKDVAMAKTAGVTDVWAKYGDTTGRPEYELLRKVTHWKAEDVEREKKVTAAHSPPTHTLLTSFGEILNMFKFKTFLNTSSENLTLILETWKKTVDVQQHFNDLELRIRNYALTVLAAVLGLAGYALKEDLKVRLFSGHVIPAATIILLLSILPWLSFYFMDRWWYHMLLLGAVDNGTFIENRWGRVLPEIRLTQSISKRSPFLIRKRVIHAGQKMDAFYLAIATLLAFLAMLAYLVIPSTPQGTQPTDHPTYRLLRSTQAP
jgi:FMN phosphatase YigB (HAD superfamily)